MNWINILKNSVLSITYILFSTIFLIEIIGYFVFDNRFNFDARFLYFSADPIVNETSTPKHFWKYKPNSDVRSLATYQKLLTNEIEYDCRFRTNEFGFIDTGNIDHYADFLVLGDSYTEGQGGCPWLTNDTLSKDKKLSKLKIINGGLMGTGILNFEQVLTYFESKMEIENLVVIAISNDFVRPDAITWPKDNSCYITGLCGATDYWHYVPIEATKGEILRSSRSRSKERGIDLMYRLKRASFTYRLATEYKQIINNHFKRQSFQPNSNLELYKPNLDALDRIKRRYPDVKIILVPMRIEVGLLGQKNVDSIVIENHLKSNLYDFRWCDLGYSDYMPVDSHPNAKGYKKLFECLSETISPAQLSEQ